MIYARMTYTLVTCALVLWPLCCNAASDNPSFKFQPGDKYYLWSVTDERISQMADGNERVIERTTRFGCDFDVEEVDENGCGWIKYTYRRTAQKIKGPDIDFDFDSNVETKKIYSQSVHLLLVIGEGFYVRISPQGRVDKINGLQAVNSSVKSNLPKLSDRDKLLVINTIDEMFSESFVRRTLEEQLAVFPDANSTNGWTRGVDIQGQKIVQKWSYKLKELKDGAAVVDVNLDISPAADTEEVVRGGVKYRRETRGQGGGQIEINLNATPASRDPIINSRITQDLVQDLKVSAQGLVLRVPLLSEPVRMHIVTTFQMTRREPNEPNQPASPDSQASRGGPADANH